MKPEEVRKPKKAKLKPSAVMIVHYFELTFRSILFVIIFSLWIYNQISYDMPISSRFAEHPVILAIFWILFFADMVFRLFPSPIRSPGCQKQFARNFQETGEKSPIISDNNATMLVAMVWIILNALIGALHVIRVLNDDFMLVLSSAYSVCDLICILFFCPFQTWFLKNRCCVTCRIYNWDFAMMFTPLFFVPNPYTWSLLGMAVILLIRWEITFYLHPERFAENTNRYLSCAECTEKLCRHKKQLQTLWNYAKKELHR